MTTVTLPAARATPTGALAAFVDRWIYVGMTLLFLAITLAGFIPDSLDKMAAVARGERPPFPWVLHAHAVLMASFLALLLAQSWLGATGRTALHQRLGVLAFALVPLIVAVGFALAPAMYAELWDRWRAAAPADRPRLETMIARRENITLVQLRMGVAFPVLVGIALWARRRHPAIHKRLMILAVAAVLPPAFDRIHALPTSWPASFASTEVYTLLALAPMLAWDVARTRTLPAAYAIWAAVTAPLALALHLAWNTPWWHATARTLLLG